MSYRALVKQINRPETITSSLGSSPGQDPAHLQLPRLCPCVSLIGSLVGASGRILVPGIYEHVAPVTEEEEGVCGHRPGRGGVPEQQPGFKRFLFDTKVGHSSMGNLKEEC